MAEQRLHSQLAPIDILTREEMAEVLNADTNRAIQERFRGLEIQRFPSLTVTATSSAQALTSTNDQTPVGPEQGDLWVIRRVVVKSFLLTDAAKYVLFRGSTPSDLTSGYTGRYLLEGFTAAGAGQPVGVGFYPGTQAVFLQPGEQIYAQLIGATIGNQYILEGEAVRVPAEMKGKILG